MFLGLEAERELQSMNEKLPKVGSVQFDDLETVEATKFKAVSIPIAVETGTRRILDFDIAQMPANGPLAKIAREKFGPRKDKRSEARRKLFERIEPILLANAEIISDENPHYIRDIARHFPQAKHIRTKGRRPRDYGLGELKRGFDPMFSLNHTFAMLRDRIKRLARKTWCISKKKEYLALHLAIYVVHHNRSLPALQKHFRKSKK